MNEIDSITKQMIDDLDRAGTLKNYRKHMMEYAEATARVMRSINDIHLLEAYRGRLDLCFELADEAAQALEAKDAEAKAISAERIPENLR